MRESFLSVVHHSLFELFTSDPLGHIVATTELAVGFNELLTLVVLHLLADKADEFFAVELVGFFFFVAAVRGSDPTLLLDVADVLLDILEVHVASNGLHDDVKLPGCNLLITIAIEKVEGLRQLLDLFLI